MYTVTGSESLVVLPAVFIADGRGLMSTLTVICTLPKGQTPGLRRINMDRVMTICYGDRRSWDRWEAIDFFSHGAAECDGAERERYTTILLKLIAGETICADNGDAEGLKFLREDNALAFCGDDPVDRSDREHEHTAFELTLPTGLSGTAQACWDYFDGTAFAYEYKGRLVVTDESLDLAEFGDGSHEAPFGAPRWVVDSWEELEQVLEATYDDLEADGLL